MISATLRFKPMDREFIADLIGLSPKEQSAELAMFARVEIDKASDQNERVLGRRVSHEVFVDGSRGGNLERVKPDGVIVANFDLGTDIVEWIWSRIVENSPVLTGAFKRSHRLYADGVEVGSPADIPADVVEIVVTSLAPYARKLERGLSRQALDGIYEAVAAVAQKRYGRLAGIRFTYRSPISGASALERWARANASNETGSARQRRKYQKNIRQPAIMIRLR
jgi:hypothetical protein